MKNISIVDAESIFNREINFLEDAVKNSKNSFHLFNLSTINQNLPESRTVVLRGFEKSPFRLQFNTDKRSPKINHLSNNSNCSALFYDKIRKVQLRFSCFATINNNNSKSYEKWVSTRLQSRKCYMGDFDPSYKLESWNPNIPIEYLKLNPKKEDSEIGYKNFCLIDLDVRKIDILELHHDGHIRFEYKNNKIQFIAP